MRYKYNTRRPVAEYERELVDYWRKHEVFERSVAERPEEGAYVFYDGPPFLTGMPHHGHLLGSTIKDAVGRYYTMKGRRVERVWGWDCHGLPAENYVEKVLGIRDRRDIGTKVSLEKYINTAKESMNHISGEWRQTIDRLGRWVDMEHAYRTMNRDFMESAWWAFKTLYEKGKIFEGEKVLMYDTKFATPVSKNEVTMDNDAYREVVDPSVFVKFRVVEGTRVDAGSSEDSGVGADAGGSGGAESSAGAKADAGASGVETSGVESGEFLLAWTTTPWTLPANMAVAVNAGLTYARVRVGEEVWVLAKELLDAVLKDEKGAALEYEVLGEMSGAELVGVRYESLFDSELAGLETAHRVYAAEYVDASAGTGLVHIAPAYGEADFELGQAEGVPTLHVIDDNGYYLPEAAEQLRKVGVRDTDEGGIEVWAANKFIAKCLHEAGAVWKIEYVKHEYPFNPRSGQRIMYRAFPSWFFDIQGSKPLMLEENEGINWFPAHLKHGRFQKNIEAAPDWNISRDRFWATAMPVWRSEEGTTVVVGGYEELYEFSGVRLEDYHRPWVDEVEFDAVVITTGAAEDGVGESGDAGAVEGEGGDAGARVVSGAEVSAKGGGSAGASVNDRDSAGANVVKNTTFTVLPLKEGEKVPEGARVEHFRRISKVLDCWFESGSMPFAQLHYPFENKEKFERNYPADFIVEYIGQVRAWFYYVHAVNTALFGEKAYKNVITTGTIAGNDGRKMSKSLGNFTDPNELMDKFSADALRFLLLSSPLLAGEDFAMQDKDVSDVYRKLNMIWNMYDFFTMYAEVDGWEFVENAGAAGESTGAAGAGKVVAGAEKASLASAGKVAANAGLPEMNPEKLANPLDRWIVSRVHELTAHLTKHLDNYNFPEAMTAILPLVDDLSNWYVRRSRRRFWKSEDDADKAEAYRTLHYCLVKLAMLMAPFTPFLAEELYRNLTGGESVHLLDWPTDTRVDAESLAQMARTRQIIERGLAVRMEKNDAYGQVKVRQPLSKLVYDGEKLPEFYENIIADEVNIKRVENGAEFALDKELTAELKQEGFVRELIRHVQKARKAAGLSVDDRIRLSVKNLPEGLPEELLALLQKETLTNCFDTGNYEYDTIVEVEGVEMTLSLEKS